MELPQRSDRLLSESLAGGRDGRSSGPRVPVTLPLVEMSELDGVTVLQADSTTGQFMAALMFRVGRFDEKHRHPLASLI